MVRNFGIRKRRFSFPTRSDQCSAGPREVIRTAAAHNINRGLAAIAIVPPRTRSRMRFEAGRLWIEASVVGLVSASVLVSVSVAVFVPMTAAALVWGLVNMVVALSRKFASFAARPDL
jgi:hypothetical protein